MSLELEIETDRAVVPPSGGTATAKVSFNTTGKAKVTNRQIVLCIDTSGSMGSKDKDGVQKLERAKRGARSVLDELKPGDSIGLVGFDSEANVAVPIREWSKSERDAIEASIDELTAEDGTDVYAGIKASWEQLKDVSEGPGTVRRIVLLSDGNDWREASTYRSLAREVADDEISIVSAGIGSEYDEDVIIALAEGSNGTPSHLTNAADMESFFADEVSNAGRVVARKPTLSIETGTGFKLEEAFVTPPNPRTTDVHAGDDAATIPLPDIEADDDVGVTVRFLLSPQSPGMEYELASFEIEADGASDSHTSFIEYGTQPDGADVTESIQIAHADAKVSAGIRDTETSTDEMERIVDEIETAQDDWDEPIARLRDKIEEATGDTGGGITAGIRKINPEDS